jgi:ribonuclease P protein component
MAGTLTFRRAQRLTHARQFDAVYAARVSRSRGPLVVHGAPNGLATSRLGLSVGRKLGTAAARNRAKRIVREAFRLDQRVWPKGIDFVVGVRGGRGVNERGLDLKETRQTLLALAAAVAEHLGRAS